MYCTNTQGAELSKVALFTSFLRHKCSHFLCAIPQYLVGRSSRLCTFFLLSFFFFIVGQQLSYAQDTDGDGVVDALDLDDDNDGILDEAELPNLIVGGFDNLTGLTVNSNNLAVGIAPWIPTVPAETNVIRVDNTGGYLPAGPSFDARGGAGNYYDVNGTTSIYQTFTLTQATTIVYSAYYSARDGNTNECCGTINIRNGTGIGGAIVSSINNINAITFNAWNRVSNTVVLAAGTYSIEVILANPQNVDEIQVLPVLDSDGDGIPNNLDLDSDNDGILDIEEVLGVDGDSDGVVGIGPPAVNAQGVPLAANGGAGYVALDSDGDGIANYEDLDADNDGITDIVEVAGVDSDGNGRVGSGIPAINASGIPTAANGGAGYAPLDRDQDAFANFIDLDSDNDGITDILEAGGIDLDSDGQVDAFADSNGDGRADSVDPNNGGTALADGDLDGDALENRLDIDADGDGIIDLIEGQLTTGTPLIPSGTDTDGDGLDDSFDPDNGGTYVVPVNTDGTDNEDYLDTDSDNDTLTDDLEGFDTNGDGIAETLPSGADADNDGLDDNYDNQPVVNSTTNPSNNGQTALDFPKITTIGVGTDRDWRTSNDFDGDGIFDLVDLDDDNDGILDVNEPLADGDGDGLSSTRDLDSDNDGIPDAVEVGGTDPDGNGILGVGVLTFLGGGVNVLGVPFAANGGAGFGAVDTDLDGVNDTEDLDADNDGIPDIVEAGGVDTTTDGRVDVFTDADVDGYANTFDTDNGGTPLTDGDQDGDGLANRIDIDADDDGIIDLIESQATTGTPLIPSGVDTDGDGFDDTFDPDDGGTYVVPVNTDGTDNDDYLDTDADNDTVVDATEGYDTDGDGLPNTLPTGTDSDGDGLDDSYDLIVGPNNTTNPSNNGQTALFFPKVTSVGLGPDRDWRESNDLDFDGILDQFDLDDDNDGILDTDELAADGDGDGYNSPRDLDSDNDGIPDAVEAGGTDPDGNGILGSGVLTFVGGDVNANGVPLAANGGAGFALIDTDLDGIDDTEDLDSDADGITDIFEAGGLDVDFDGRADVATDTDGDGYVDLYDTDNGGTPLADGDIDFDGFANRVDIDADGDGIIDLIESQVTTGTPVVPVGVDTDGDGIDNAFDIDIGGTFITPINTDGTDTPDYLDLDSDNDSVIDQIEGYDTNNDQVPETVPSGLDTDVDGLDDNFDLFAGLNNTTNPSNNGQTAITFPGGATPNWRVATDVDTDGDGFLNSVDLDDDNDGILDTDECGGVAPITNVFTYTGADQAYNVPAGASTITIKAWGAGGRGDYFGGSVGGPGGYSEVTINVASLPTTNLVVTVGQGGNNSTGAVTYGNGGAGSAAGFFTNNGAGGGMSAVSAITLTTPGAVVVNDLVVIAGGGGSAPTGSTGGFLSGGGGGTNGLAATNNTNGIAGGGGSQVAGGTSTSGNPGGFLVGGNSVFDGGAGGGGFYGGGSGSNIGGQEGSGGGGSGYVSPLATSSTTISNAGTQNAPNNTDTDYIAGVGVGGNNFAIGGATGGNGLVVIQANFSASCNVDADVLANQFDLDSDNDGIPDVIEAGGSDPDGDGRAGTGLIPPVDANGVPTVAAGGYVVFDTDGDSYNDYQDIDSDDDGIVDLIESQASTATPIVPIGSDLDVDGIDDRFDPDNGGTLTVAPINTDGADNPDYLDLDSDNDGLSDDIEGWDLDGDYAADVLPAGTDADDDGLDDNYDDFVGPDAVGNPTNNNQTSNDFPDITTASLTAELDWRESNIITCAPGGVSSNILLWLKADEGGTVWRDISNNFVTLTTTGTVDGSNLMNFNPTNTFDGADFYTSTLDASADTYADLAVVGAYRQTQTNAGSVWGEEDGGFDRYILSGAGAGQNEAVSTGSGTESGITGLGTSNVTTVSTVIFDDAVVGGSEVFVNGQSSRNFTANHAGQTTNNFQIGALGNSTQLFNGRISEIIVYNQLLATATERQQIESYLTLKYGVTLSDDNNGNGTPLEPGEGDYLFSDASVLWDADETVSFQNNVAGIARDDASCLTQRQSRSSNADAIVTIGLEDGVSGPSVDNASNGGSFATDRVGLMWGHDGEALYDNDENIDFDPAQVLSRLNREWRVQRVGLVGAVTVTYDVSNLLGPTGIGTNDENQIVLMVDADGDFSSGASLVLQDNPIPGDGVVNFNFDFPDGTYFTLGSTEFAALPITLVDFGAQAYDDHVLVNWTTASEVDNDFFRVERSQDGVDFQTVGFVTGAGTTDIRTEYALRDTSPFEGISYYRLVDIDFAGEENYSEIVRVNYQGEVLKALPYPNPAPKDDLINLRISDPEAVSAVYFFDQRGTGREAKYDVRADEIQISTRGLTTGFYFMRVMINEKVVSHKVIIR